MPLATTLSQAPTASGYGRDDPLVIAVGRAGRRPAHLARGCYPAGSSGVIACSADPGRGGPTISTLIYVASLAKQVVAACAALLMWCWPRWSAVWPACPSPTSRAGESSCRWA
jgi:hypothetical protein